MAYTRRNVYAAHYVFEDKYVITGIQNAFNSQTSYWISKEGYTFSLYCFSLNRGENINSYLKNIKEYIRMFEDSVKKEG